MIAKIQTSAPQSCIPPGSPRPGVSNTPSKSLSAALHIAREPCPGGFQSRGRLDCGCFGEGAASPPLQLEGDRGGQKALSALAVSDETRLVRGLGPSYGQKTF